MDKAILLGIAMCLVACVCNVAAGACGGSPKNCTDDFDCDTAHRFFCLEDYCRKCRCNNRSECRYSAQAGGVYCDCGSDTTGTFCECEVSGCSCDDKYGFGSRCSEYSNNFVLFDNRKIDSQANNAESETYSVNRDGVDTVEKCKVKCIEFDCTTYEWQTNSGQNKCTVFKIVNYIFNRINIVENTNWQLYVRECNVCVPE